jgi:chemotaxis protein CheZ
MNVLTQTTEACASQAAPAPHADERAAMPPGEVLQRVGILTRKLHEALRELGYDQALESAVSSLPDARARLGYIATLTGRAADRVLTAAETGRDIQERLERDARELAAREPATPAVDFLARVAQDAATTNAHFSEIMLAQDFHDLTGQVIKRVVDLAQGLEAQLVNLLIEAAPPQWRAEKPAGPCQSGPVIDGAGRDDVVTDQSQVDDLLASLGF